MKFFRRNLPVLLFACAALFFVREWVVGAKSTQEVSYLKGVETCHLVAAHHPFVVIVIGDKNQKYYQKCLRSVLEQDYGKYRVLYLDDGSTQGIDAFLAYEHPSVAVERITQPAIHRTERLCRAIHTCKDDEIVVFLDSTDWFAHEQVLSYLNYCYQQESVWMTYGSYMDYPTYKKKKATLLSPDDKISYREKMEGGSILPPLRSGYAGLFKKVALDDLVSLDASEEQLLLLPALEMAAHHCQRVQEMLYISNRRVGKGTEQEALCASLAFRRYVKTRPPYLPIEAWKDLSSEGEIVLDAKEEEKDET